MSQRHTETYTPQWVTDQRRNMERAANARRAQRRMQRFTRPARAVLIAARALHVPIPVFVKISAGIVLSNFAFNAIYYSTCPRWDTTTNALDLTAPSALYTILDALHVISAVCGN